MKNPSILALSISLLFAVACHKKDRPQPMPGCGYPHSELTFPADTLGPAISMSAYPLTIGNTWVYDNGDTMKAVSDTTINSIKCTKIICYSDSVTGVGYYANLSDGFYLIALQGHFAGNVQDPRGGNVLDLSFTSGFHILSPASQLAKFPVDTSSTWNSNELQGDNTYSQPRKWVDFATITSTFGTFNCTALSSSISRREYYDAKKGLVRLVELSPLMYLKSANYTPGGTIYTTSLVWTNF